jgi:hypothetical protein
MSSTSETGHVTGTKDKDHDLIWFTEQSPSNALRLEDSIQDAERLGDTELAEFSGALRLPAARLASRARSSWAGGWQPRSPSQSSTERRT